MLYEISRRELAVQWDDLQAEYRYKLISYRLVPMADAEPTEAIYTYETGDRDWADRIANHYKLTLPDQPKD